MIQIVDIDGDIVLMDGVADAYLCIGRDRSPHGQATAGNGPDESASCDAANRLAIAGIDPTKWRWADQALARVRHDLPCLDTASAYRIAASIPFMIAAGLTTTMRLRGPISRYRGRARHAEIVEPARLSKVVAAFDALRPFVPRLGRCLPHSIYLRDFLSLHGIAATLVFGVRTHPFEAHCWVEHDGRILNDTADHVAWFTPIYAC